VQVGESAMREVVGADDGQVLYESRQEIADAVRALMQENLDRYGTGILVLQGRIQNAQPAGAGAGGVRHAVKATQDRERLINEGQAYANDVVRRRAARPRACCRRRRAIAAGRADRPK